MYCAASQSNTTVFNLCHLRGQELVLTLLKVLASKEHEVAPSSRIKHTSAAAVTETEV